MGTAPLPKEFTVKDAQKWPTEAAVWARKEIQYCRSRLEDNDQRDATWSATKASHFNRKLANAQSVLAAAFAGHISKITQALATVEMTRTGDVPTYSTTIPFADFDVLRQAILKATSCCLADCLADGGAA